MEAALFYVASLLLLFFFWIYGIVAFVRDLKNRVIPGVRRLLSERESTNQEVSDDADGGEDEHQLL